MTQSQKDIIVHLLAGGSIASYRLRDRNNNPMMKVNPQTFYWLKSEVLRRMPGGFFIINKTKVRQLHGNSWIKKTYKESLKLTQSSTQINIQQ